MAQVVAGLLTSAVVRIASDKLSSVIAEKANLCWNFNNDLGYMKETMETIAAVLKDAEKQSIRNESVRLWLKRLKYAAFDISDMMDDYYQDTTTKAPGMLSCFTSGRKSMALVNKMKNMREELRRINKERQHFNFTAANEDHVNEGPNVTGRETTSDVKEARILGRDAEKKEIKGILLSHRTYGTMILPIYGLGGMGKSTLAQLVYNDTQFKQYDHRVWVYVSEVFDFNKIGNSVISQLSGDGGHQNLDTLQMINQSLHRLLHAGKKILIVLDDIWKEDALELNKLKDMFHVDSSCSMIDVLVTTRSQSIARKICTDEPYKLQPLAHNICWDIIKLYSGFEGKSNKQKLEEIGLEIAKKCGGVALAAQALGYMLCTEDLDGWSKINKNDIWSESFGGDDDSPHKKVLPSLKLSYEWMVPTLRLCFSYCAIFPKGYDIYEDDLIHQWIALDFIKEPSDGKKYIDRLLGMSFLQLSKLPNTSNETMIRYTMHDLVHDLARSVVGDELIVIDVAEEVKTSEQKYCRYALVVNYDGQIKLPNILLKKVRALHFSGCSKIDFHDSSFSFMKRLGILDFSECSCIQLLSSIGLLKQLKCLIAPQLREDTSLPEAIGELLKLQYLNLRGSSLILELHKSIGKLSCLIYLSLSGCSGILKIPDSIGGLKSLVHLDMSNCSGITRLPGTVGNLTNLQHLDLSRCSGVVEVPESLGGLNELRHLNLSYCGSIIILPEATGCLNKLRYLDMGYNEHIKELPESFQNLQSLVHLNLSHCRCGKGLPEALCGLTSLEHLNMSSSPYYGNELWKDICDAMGNLTNLKYLNLNRARGLSSSDFIGSLTNLEYLNLSSTPIVSLPEGIGNLKKLHTLNLSYCMSLKFLPDSIGEVAALKSLLVAGCSDELIEMANSMLHNSQTLCFKVRADSGSDCSNLPLLEDRNVNKLKVYSLENVRSPEEARTFKLSEKDKLCDLELSWTHENVDRFVEDKDLLGILVPPGGLMSLGLHNYRGQSFPNWFMDISHHLPNLAVISLDSLPEICSLPPLGQLPNLEVLKIFNCYSVTEIGKDFYGGKQAFCRLSRFILRGMNGLEEWYTTYSLDDGVEELMFPVLDELVVEYCPRLRLTSCLPVCRECRIVESDAMLSSLEELGNKICHLTKLCIFGSRYKNIRLFHQITALHELEISYCSSLTSLPESMRHLTSLRSLRLKCCSSISSLPEWLGDLSSLRSLTIEHCEEIKSLPACIHKLTALQTLRILYNSELKRCCESAENKKQIAHIKHIVTSPATRLQFFITAFFLPKECAPTTDQYSLYQLCRFVRIVTDR